jgi:RNA polymerase sigma-70 factor (sigma-E family)
VDGSFEEYVVGQGSALLRFAYLLSQDRHRAEDLVQEALAKAQRRWSKLDRPGAYLRKAVLHEYLSWRRRRSSQEAVLAEFPDIAMAGRDGGDPAGPVTDQDEFRRLLAGLPRQQRAVIILRYYEDLPDAEIGELLGCSAVTVRSHAAKGLARLRATLSPTGEKT